MVPPNTRLPAVAITPLQGGLITLCSHRAVPVSGSIATTLPQLSSGANRTGRLLGVAPGGRLPPAPKIPLFSRGAGLAAPPGPAEAERFAFEAEPVGAILSSSPAPWRT